MFLFVPVGFQVSCIVIVIVVTIVIVIVVSVIVLIVVSVVIIILVIVLILKFTSVLLGNHDSISACTVCGSAVLHEITIRIGK